MLFQRIFIQNIAFSVHQVAYKDRIDKSRQELEILDRLSEAVRGMGLVKAFKSITQMDDTILIRKSSPYNAAEIVERESILRQISREKPTIQSQLSIIMDQSPTDPDKRMESMMKIQDSNPTKQRPSLFQRAFSTKSKIMPEEDPAQKPSHLEQVAEERLSIPTGSSRQTVAGLAIGGYNKRKTSLELFSDKNAEALAIDLFEKLRTGDQIFIGAIYRFFPEEQRAKEAFDLFDRYHRGFIKQKDLAWVIKRIYKEKRALTKATSDLSQALGNLNKILYVISAIVSMLVVSPLYGINLQSILPFASIFLALSFVFGGIAKNGFEW